MNKLLDNLRHLPTTLAGIGVTLAALPQMQAIQSLMHLSPVIANDITAVGMLGGALVLMFGANTAK